MTVLRYLDDYTPNMYIYYLSCWPLTFPAVLRRVIGANSGLTVISALRMDKVICRGRFAPKTLLYTYIHNKLKSYAYTKFQPPSTLFSTHTSAITAAKYAAQALPCPTT